MGSSKSDSTAEAKVTDVEGPAAQESSNTGNVTETTSSNDELLDQIQVPPLAPEERIVSAVSCNGGISYTTVAPSELGAVPEEDEEAATSSTPSTVVRCHLIVSRANFRRGKGKQKETVRVVLQKKNSATQPVSLSRVLIFVEGKENKEEGGGVIFRRMFNSDVTGVIISHD